MRIADLYRLERPIFSFEFFPPRDLAAAGELLQTIRDLALLSPDFVSVTCPLAVERRPLTFALIARIAQEVGVASMAHVVTMNYTREEMRGVLEALRIGGVENILALRGDLPKHGDRRGRGDFEHASDLARFAQEFDFCIGGAAHPEMHPESKTWDDEIRHARVKVEAGCEFLATQLFFDNEDYFRYVERARAAGIAVPIVPGIMPITSVKGIRRIAAINGNRIPDALSQEIDVVADDPAAVHRVGVRHATEQCESLLARGAPGIHFYTLNRSPATREILVAVRGGGAV